MKRVILITGTPCVGKTTTAKQLATKLDADYINLTEYAKTNDLTLGEDKKRQTTIINEEKMRNALKDIINQTQNSIIIDGHYAASVVPPNLSTHVFVLRRNPKELKKLMQKNNYPEAKLNENLSAEILDICLVEALQTHEGKVCELDTTDKNVEETVNEVLAVVNGKKKCYSGIVDWLCMLEKENIIDDYLKI